MSDRTLVVNAIEQKQRPHQVVFKMTSQAEPKLTGTVTYAPLQNDDGTWTLGIEAVLFYAGTETSHRTSRLVETCPTKDATLLMLHHPWFRLRQRVPEQMFLTDAVPPEQMEN